MNKLNKQATAIFQRLIAKTEPTGHVKINNAEGTFMPLSVERIGTASGLMGVDMSVFSLAHYYEQNGDLMADPEMTFFVYQENIFPASYRQDGLGIFRESIIQVDGTWKLSRKLQQDQTAFANMWLRNIQQQQDI